MAVALAKLSTKYLILIMKKHTQISQSITSRDSETLKRYFNEIKRIPLLTAEEEAELARKSKAGDIEARDRLVKCNLRFVFSTAKRFVGQGVDLEDLISEGNLGLFEAVERFDENKGFRFLSYAVNWVYKSIMQAISNYGRLVRLPQNKLNGISKVVKASSQLEQTFHRLPTVEEIAEALELPDEVVAQLMRLSSRPVSLDAPLATGSETTMAELLLMESFEPADKRLMNRDMEHAVSEALSRLPEIESRVLQMSYGMDTDRKYTADEIGAKLGLPRERVRQFKNRAKKRLRTNDSFESLRQHLAA